MDFEIKKQSYADTIKNISGAVKEMCRFIDYCTDCRDNLPEDVQERLVELNTYFKKRSDSENTRSM